MSYVIHSVVWWTMIVILSVRNDGAGMVLGHNIARGATQFVSCSDVTSTEHGPSLRTSALPPRSSSQPAHQAITYS